MNISIGLLFFDTCYSSALAQRYLTDVLNVNSTTKYCSTKNKNKCLDRTKVVALLGDYSSHVTIAVSLNSIHRMLVIAVIFYSLFTGAVLIQFIIKNTSTNIFEHQDFSVEE